MLSIRNVEYAVKSFSGEDSCIYLDFLDIYRVGYEDGIRMDRSLWMNLRN